jgi:uncharacterized protein YkwD
MKHFVIAAVVLALASPLAHSDVEETRTTLRMQVLNLINKDRRHYNLPPVELDLEASRIGDDYCREQIRDRSTGHFGTNGLSPYMRYSFAGGNDGVSENAAAWSADYTFNERALYEMSRRSQDAMMGEMPPNDGHRRVILDPHATHVGIGLAWEKGEFRLVQEFVRRYVEWTRTVPRTASRDERITVAGRPLRGARVEAITVHYERMPQPMPAHVASAMSTYSLPEKRKDFLPRVRSRVSQHSEGAMQIARGRRGDFAVDKDGAFTFPVPFTEGPGVYTVVVWIARDGVKEMIPASNLSIKVE